MELKHPDSEMEHKYVVDWDTLHYVAVPAELILKLSQD